MAAWRSMCHPPGSHPPDVPADLRRISGGAGGEDVIITSEDATRFRAHLAKADEGDRGVVIAPDVRGLHPFYEELAERFASAGVHAIAIDYFGRTAGTTHRGDDFEYREHLAKTKTTTIQADIASAIGHLRGATDARRIYVLGFCMGGRQAFFASAEHAERRRRVRPRAEGRPRRAPLRHLSRRAALVLRPDVRGTSGVLRGRVAARARLHQDRRRRRASVTRDMERSAPDSLG